MRLAKVFTRAGLPAMALALVGALAFAPNVLANGGKTYSVTIFNATKGQPVTPGLVIAHRSGYSLFEIGATASPELEELAETGNPAPLAGTLTQDHIVVLPDGSNHPELTFPSESSEGKITTKAKFLTVLGMLAGTNDAFYAVRGVKLPTRGAITVYAPAFDAGSEINNETTIDVPALAGATHVFPGPAGEGYIHVHNGIHGGADLDPATWDWRNPVVAITIKRLNR